MRIVNVRRISQMLFLALFLWLCVVTTIGTKWWQLRGWPVNFFLQIDPLVAIGTLLTTHTLYAGLLFAGATIGLTIVFGRLFCGWVCPFGTIQQTAGWLAKRGRKPAELVKVNRYRGAQSVKYFLLFFVLAAAASGLLAKLSLLVRTQPRITGMGIAILLLVAGLLLGTRALKSRKLLAAMVLTVAAWTALAVFLPVEKMVSAALLGGFLDPIPLLHRSINLVLLPIADRTVQRLASTPQSFDGAWIIGLIFLSAVGLNWLFPRFYCRFVCPLGALLGVLGRFALWRVAKTKDRCSMCGACEEHCEGACQPSHNIRQSECVLCMNCLRVCEDRVISYRMRRSAAGEHEVDVTRRGFMISAVSGLLAMPMIRLSARLGGNWNPRLIRPPGSLPEPDFLERCIKCGQCMRICPTNIIQPAGLEAGVEGIWTPTLNFRIGTSGCQLDCVACSNLCPTAAIRPITLNEKLGRNQFADAGPIRLGTAFVDRGRCLPCCMDKPCIVCQENCPVSPKAIFTRDFFSTIRDGFPPVTKADELTLEFGQAAFRPGQFATGDYYVIAHGRSDDHPRRIVDNTASGLSIDSTSPWDPAPQPGNHIELQIKLQRPYIDPALCIGCGICEHECPVTGIKAIRVTAENETRNRRHTMVV